jgi:predicted secreted hydrolase
MTGRDHSGRPAWSRRLLTMCAALMLILEAAACSFAEDVSYLAVTGPCNLRFPEDHGAHPGYRTEWWYYTGNVESDGGERFGFQLTFFRNQISPPGSERSWPEPHSAWRAQQLYLAHAALSDISGKHFYHAENTARGALGLAGVDQDEGATTVFLENWSAMLAPSRQTIHATADQFALDLTLTPAKEPALHGESGYSLKGATPERASCYYSFTHLDARGTVAIGGQQFQVNGLAWMDHEFSSSPLDPDLAGWDWLSLQLSNNSELMIYLLRRSDGTYSSASSGTFVDPEGRAAHLDREDFSVEVLDHWKSPRSRARYPSRWRVTVPALQTALTIRPNLEDQEMETPESTRITYWEGSVSVEGTSHGRLVSGNGYVELTGYAGRLEALH